MESTTQTPLIDLAPKLFGVVRKAQNIIASCLNPSGYIIDNKIIGDLFNILNDEELVRRMREVEEEAKKPSSTSNLILEKVWHSSKNVRATFYHVKDYILVVEFLNGSSYEYRDFPQSEWDRLIQAESIGSFIATEVKGKYQFFKV